MPAPAPVVVAPPVPTEPRPHGFAIIRPGAMVHLRADDSLPPVKLADGARGFTMAVVGSEGELVAFETLVGDTHCGHAVDGVWGMRLRWLVAPEDLVSVTTKRVTAEYSDGTKTELLAGVPLRADGDGWLADADGVEIWVRLPADAVGRYYDAGDRAFAEGTREPLGKGEDQLLYDRTRALNEAHLLAVFGDGRSVATFVREEKDGRIFGEVRSRCAAIRVAIPSSRTKIEPETEEHAAAMLGLIGSGGGGAFAAGFAMDEAPKPTWYVEPGTTAYWRDGTVGGLVDQQRTLDTTPREVASRMCFELKITDDASSRFDLCFDPTSVHETVGASPGELDRPLGELVPGGELGELAELGGGGLLGGVPGGSTSVPRTRSGPPTVTGSLDKDIIRRIVRAHINEVRTCYNIGLKKDPTLAGEVTIAFTISGTGTVSSATVKDDTVPDAKVGKCIAKAVKRWVFPKPTGGGLVAVRYPFVLSPS